jgi:peptidoglycan/LPS O-acetylase OafA/YrhL
MVMVSWCLLIIYASIFFKDSGLSLRNSVQDLLEKREVESTEARDLLMLDGLRVLCLIWILTFGVAQFTMGGAAYNPWTLQDYFQTIEYTLVYSANFGFDEFFMLSAFFAYLKISKYIS